MGAGGSDSLDWGAMRPALVRFLARRTGCAAAADDLAQELWLRLHRRDDAGGPIDNPVAYLWRAAANASFDWRRRAGPAEAASADLTPALADDSPSPERTASNRQAADLLAAAIADLPPRCRQALLLCRVEGLTMKEAARRMGVSPRTVENHLVRATVLCRRALIDAGAWP